MEDANLKHDLKIELLTALVVFAYVVAVKEGLLQSKNIKMKKYSNGKIYPEISIFRKGYTSLQTAIKTLAQFTEYVEKMLCQISSKVNNDSSCNEFV